MGTGDGGIAVYGAVDGAPLSRVPLTGGDAVLALAGSPGDERLFATTYGTLHAVDVASLTDVALVEQNGIYRTLAVSADGAVVYTSEFDRAELRSYLLAVSAESLEVVQRTPANLEATYLLLAHCFALGYRRVEWKCDNRNERSKRSALRMGFTFEGIQQQHMIIKNRSRDTAWFRILDREWPGVKTHLEGLLKGTFPTA